ncbi:MAG: glutamine amidotransferase [Nitriliruptoraceae bacterium]
MVGGYLTFGGIHGRGRWHGTAVEDVLPVTIKDGDDRCERPDGVIPTPVSSPVLAEVPNAWPHVLGYNRLVARPDASVIATVDDDPFLALGAGLGKTVAYASDCSPHWAPAEFTDWEGYPALWNAIVTYAADVG